MALIEVFHVVASNLLIDADDPTDIPQGSIVSLDANGLVQLATGAAADTQGVTAAAGRPVGVAGDSRSTGITSFTPESGSAQSGNPKTSLTGSLIIGGVSPAQRFTQNRVSDNYNEVVASGKMTVYHGGGEFWTSEFIATDTFTPSTHVFASAATPGSFTDTVQGGAWVGTVLTSPTDYPSGVPGTDTGFTQLPEGGNSMTWGQLLHVKLNAI